MAARGRHRRYRPSRASRASLTVTASGAGIALPLIGVSHAQAAPVETWEKVAACESGNRWHVNTGNGYFGGLQFKQSTWDAYGGRAYAVRADQASRAEQIAVAEKVLAGQGPGAWPQCGPGAGLARDAAAPRAARTQARPAAAPPAAPAVPRQRPAAEGEPDGQEHQRGSRTHRVEQGDSLSAIADSHRVPGGWPSLYERNRSTIGDDPHLILPGQRLHLTATGPKGPAPKQSAPKPSAPPSAKPAPPEQQPEDDPPKPPRPEPRKAEAAPPQAEPEQQERQKPAGAGQREERSTTDRAERRPAAPAFSSPVPGAAPGTAYRASGASWSSGYHTGVDFPLATGTSVKAVTRATVVSAGWAGAYGYQVVLKHHDGRYSQYAHLSAISVRPGQQVGAGTTLGRSGNTGNSSGPHLHFEVRTGPGYGTDINPLAYLREHGVTV
ncbi:MULTISPECIES: transglycosylase family protein [Streptomyces]|uniref:transglycosylase family protein n=1 Tax=Streptomyces TaxID=1883 RepID=UPI002248C9A1|nr:transglycosylase family protein [Streptomyces sp. JHD 1]MCX2970708.1 transglycosylase family protein [Streptomyces sp. JHD 1]